MKLKNKLLIFFLILFIIFIPSLLFLGENLSFGVGNNFIFGNYINNILLKVFPKNEYLLLKTGDFYYRLGDYEKAGQKYNKVNCKSDENCFKLNHNLGNTLFKIGEEQLSKIDKSMYYLKSLTYYQKALDIKNDTETQKNYDFVLDKLKKLQEPEKKEEEGDKNNERQEQKDKNEKENNSGEKEEKNDDNKQKQGENKKEQEENNSGEKDQIQPKGPSMNIDENAIDKGQKLSDEEKEKIKEYIKGLKEDEKQNLELNKEGKSEPQDIFDIFNNNIYFDENGLKKGDGW
ncbi:hypothetical protein H3C61_03895 [Candidatus Gracilibacteria bacterium]|nr:hypothetical protein [Candidatus Gracilibacteria bacterium]